MIKRLTWFVGGAVIGAAAAGAAKKKAAQVATQYTPANVARATTTRVREAVTEGRRAAKEREAELRAVMNGTPTSLADHLGDGDRVYVDGRPVEPGQVIVLRQVREERSRKRRA
jgi:hypothetical protein